MQDDCLTPENAVAILKGNDESKHELINLIKALPSNDPANNGAKSQI